MNDLAEFNLYIDVVIILYMACQIQRFSFFYLFLFFDFFLLHFFERLM